MSKALWELAQPDTLLPGGALHSAVVSEGEGAVVYHPLVVGKRIVVGGARDAVRLEECAGWFERTAVITEAEVARAATHKTTTYVWATPSGRILASDVEAPGCACFDFRDGRWTRREYALEVRCAWPGCAAKEENEGLCKRHQREDLPLLLRRLNEATVPEVARDERHRLRRDLLLERNEASALAFLEKADAFSKNDETPLIWAQPRSRFDVKKGTSVSFKVVVTGKIDFFQWLKDGEPSRHSTNRPLLVVRNVDAADAGHYRCRLGQNVESEEVVLSVEKSLEKSDLQKKRFSINSASLSDCRVALSFDPDDDKFNSQVLLRMAKLTPSKKAALYFASDAAARYPASLEAHLTQATLASDLGYLEEALNALDKAERLRGTAKDSREYIHTLRADLEHRYFAAGKKRKETNRRYKPPAPEGKNIDVKTKEDLALFGLAPSPSRRDLRRAYLTLALHQHPDKGGDHDSFLRIQAAYDRLTTNNQSQENNNTS